MNFNQTTKDFLDKQIKDVLDVTQRNCRNFQSFVPEGTIILASYERGGVVGVAEVTNCVTESESPWFFGEYGFVLDNAQPLPFMPCKGQLGFFEIPNAHQFYKID